MKLLFLNLYSGGIARGAESFAHELASKLSDKNEVKFVGGNSTQISAHQFPKTGISKWINRKRFFIDSAGLAILKFTLQQIKEINHFKPDWVIPLNGFWQVLILKILQPWFQYKILITGHSGPGWDERWNLYLHPNYFIATTKPTLDWAKKTAPLTQVRLIPYGIELSNFHNRTVPAELKKLPRPIYLCPAALVEYKRVDLAINAVAKLDKGSLVILGQGDLHPQLSDLAKALLPERYVITHTEYKNVPDYFAAADCVTLPSMEQENSPMVILESLAANKPCVVTDTPRNRWALEDAGLYVDPSNITQYVSQLRNALKTNIQTTKPLQKFKWESVLEQYQQIFNS